MENMLQSRLTLHFHAGFDANGKEIFKTKNFSNISISATKEQLKATAEALQSLQVHMLENATRNNVYDVLN